MRLSVYMTKCVVIQMYILYLCCVCMNIRQR